MKKLISLMLILSTIFMLSACNTSNNLTDSEQEDNTTACVSTDAVPAETEDDAKAYEYEQAQMAYAELNRAADLCEYAMDVIYGAWYFSIYEAQMTTDAYINYDGYEARTGLEYDEIEPYMQLIGLSYNDSYYFTDFTIAVGIAKLCLSGRNVYSEAQTCLDNAKAYIKEITNQYADYTAYPTLKLYYSEISSYFEFAQSPTGSFSQLETTIGNYETNIRTYKNDLSFTLE